MEQNKILATVNGKEITEQDVQFFLRNLGQETAMQIQSQKDGIDRVVYELVNQELMYLDGLNNKLQEDEIFKKELEVAKKSILIQYSVNKLLSSISVTDEEVAKYYEEHKDQFKKQEAVRARHILVKEEKEANDIVVKIKDGLSFEEAAKECSTCPSKDRGGDLGEFNRGMMVPEFEEVAFNLNKGELSNPVKTQFGYHIIEVTDKIEPSTMILDEVREEIKDRLLKSKQQEAYFGKTNELKEKYEVKVNL